MPDLIPVVPASAQDQTMAQQVAQKWSLPFSPQTNSGLALFCCEGRVELRQLDEPKVGAVYVDFASDALTYRRQHGGGKKEAIARAVGLKGKDSLNVVDATAGLGRDAFVLASLGCTVTMIERSAAVAAILDNGLTRAASHPLLLDWLPQKMRLLHGVSYGVLEQWTDQKPDVVYLDPMFPHRRKSALVKKEMRLFQQLLGPDQDADKLLKPALALAQNRVVVKRPEQAPYLDGIKPTMAIESKKHRFDVYLNN